MIFNPLLLILGVAKLTKDILYKSATPQKLNSNFAAGNIILHFKIIL